MSCSPWVQTYSGIPFDLDRPRVEDVHLVDIAHHLANICRYNGATREFYSVAQHSVLVSMIMEDSNDPELVRWGLLHDAAEAYIGDIVRPLKRGLLAGSGIEGIETQILQVVAERFKLCWPVPQYVYCGDEVALWTEKRDLLASCSRVWDKAGKITPYPYAIKPAIPSVAKEMFLKRAAELGLSEGE